MDDSTSADLELKTHLAEYESIKRDIERLLTERQQILLGTLAASVVLVGIVVESPWFRGLLSVRFFLVLALAFSLITWWYLRTNHVNLVLQLYLLKKLKPRIQSIAGNNSFGWVVFEWRADETRTGRAFSYVLTLSKYGLTQGGAIASLLLFAFRTHWRTWTSLDWSLIVLNGFCLAISIGLLIATNSVLHEVRDAVYEQTDFTSFETKLGNTKNAKFEKPERIAQ